MAKLENILVKYIWIIVLILSVPAIWALLVPGYYGASDDLHVAWLFEMDHTLHLGQFPPRFVPDLSFQFGYPLFNFVFPLPFYLGELFHLTGFNLVDSVKLVFLITVPLSIYFMYKLLREFAGPLIALAGAVLYVYTPYRATDLYVRGAIGEIVGFVFLPLICLALLKVASRDSNWRLKWAGVGALAIGGLILTHDIMAYMFFPLILILGLIFLAVNHFHKKVFLGLGVMAILGLLTSCYFWLPAVTDSHLMKYDTVFNFQDHFPTIKQLIVPYWGYGASVPGPYDGMSFFVGIVNWLAFLVGLIILIWKRARFSKPEKVFLWWGYGVFLVAFIMMNYRSTFLWQHLPELPYFQFPWRFLILTTFVTPIFLLTLEKVKYSRFIGFGLVIVIIAINTFQFRPQDFLGRTDAYYLDRYVPYPLASDAYKQTQEEYLRLPMETKVRPDHIYTTFFATQPINIVNINPNPLDFAAKINVNLPTEVSFNKYNFPGWSTVIDGKQVISESGQPFGQISFPLTVGSHTVQIHFQETPLKLVLDLISLLGVIWACWFIFSPKKIWKFKRG